MRRLPRGVWKAPDEEITVVASRSGSRTTPANTNVAHAPEVLLTLDEAVRFLIRDGGVVRLYRELTVGDWGYEWRYDPSHPKCNHLGFVCRCSDPGSFRHAWGAVKSYFPDPQLTDVRNRYLIVEEPEP